MIHDEARELLTKANLSFDLDEEDNPWFVMVVWVLGFLLLSVVL